ncbi:MAG: cell division protein FtsQ/DivIB [Candidatus Cryptobacteroides sp.]
MKRPLKIILYSLALTLFFVGTGVLICLSDKKDHSIACREIELNISENHHFISEEDVSKKLNRAYGVIIGERVDELDLFRIESILEQNLAIKNCEAWATKDGILHIDIEQREPVMKVMDKKSNSYYVDKDGIIFPVSADYEAQVPVILCDTAKGMNQDWLSEAISLVYDLSSSPKWKERISSYSVEENNDFVLHSDKEKIIFGDFKDRQRKLAYLDKYYSDIRPLDKEYKVVNLKYKGQIICRKKTL